MSRREASEAADSLGWRLVLGALRASAATASLEAAAALAVVAVKACGEDADRHLALHAGAGRLDLVLSTASAGAVTARDVQLAEAITQSLKRHGAAIVGSNAAALELAIDATDIPKVRPFWAAVLGYVGEVHGGETGALVDPSGQGPAVWFQQMHVPRPQRNRLHVDVSVPHDEAGDRVAAALRAGGTLVSDRAARAFWVLADAEGNEVCICTWQDREEEPGATDGAADRG